MWHLITAPVLLPMLTALVIMLPPVHYSPMRRRWLSMISAAIQLILALMLLLQVQQQGMLHYAVGNWQAPFGIILVADKLSVVMVCLTSFLALGAISYGSAGEDEKGSFFHPLFQFQIMGINGAFLTGDLFNLFVFFEVLLIASYALLIHAGGKNKTKAAVHYVVLNLSGSAIFLFALAVLYGTLGTLNIADMTVKVAALPAEDMMLVKAGGLMLMIVFALKAAVLPLQFWLPATYSSASAPVAALFAVMTKIGVYALLRVYSSVFGEGAGPLAGLAADWLLPAGLATIALGAVGVMASRDFRKLVANLVLVSVGTLVSLVALQTELSAAAALYYTVHSTLVTAALFLLADLIANQRGKAADRLVSGRRVIQPVLLGGLFILAALTVAGLPPFSGFIGKLMLLQAATEPTSRLLLWSFILISSLLVIIGLSRAGSTLFWRISGSDASGEKAAPLQVFGVCWLLLASPLLVAFAGPLTGLSQQAAAQLYDTAGTVDIILRQPASQGDTP
ncbi:monovalent cation/H+ antiporter subunit D [Rheinheimera sp. YQF-2]|uniref:Monovalent cation/H+ antiporter subunit D n=1 Tax=Rheinheimera lutimaris TaxID=2740584 RepID=A0A7Y5ARU1_9GAMM|nr:monovalent cation/H+ antiporter subunit D [Rheinheimera lutimaris]NRQ43358.1 monovalent cation/H+ antiporter subunit D [Rheinheimera lutimaris]